ncbi:MULTISPECIES: phage tail protein [Polyangium]|uniref:Phage tail protein n=2 Tax=Polyangium TaxID=55 RepID=A0A9X3X171_9BACT|nr:MULTISPECIES: phage tail protein [Polyangium]MDC0747866.1 phage tail protein [Polyangium mundeleinium]MDC3955585.1 phage tail protein [Polyangium jinanense]MDC3982227.1 phage tail protein [Polyangium jinanense]MDI1476547.1 phage tail protein [Polyangium sp. y55x31]
MSTSKRPPYGAFNFTVSIDGSDAFGGFSDVSGLNTEFTMAEYREGSDPDNHVRKVPGIYKTGDVTLKRGIVDSRAFWDWIADIRKRGPLGRKEVLITLLDEARKPVQAWKLLNVTPMKYTGPTLAAKGGGDVAMEEIVLSAEDIQMGFPDVT